MAERRGIYRCEVCGNIVEVLHAGRGELVCCGKPMALLRPKTEDTGKEKHVPVVEYGETIKVRVGSVEHPMEDDHYIKWVEIVTDDGIYRQFLSPGQAPEAEFPVRADRVIARGYCTVHGLWRS